VLKLSKQLEEVKLKNEQLQNELQFKQNQIEKLINEREKEKEYIEWKLKKQIKKDSILMAFNNNNNNKNNNTIQQETKQRKSVSVCVNYSSFCSFFKGFLIIAYLPIAYI
jgi:hypothetical protein